MKSKKAAKKSSIAPKSKSREEGPKQPPPKKTGKTNLRLGTAPAKPETEKPKPVDNVVDFDKPTRGDGSGTPEQEPTPPAAEKGSLTVRQPDAKTVVGDRMQMYYLKPTFSRTNTGKRLVAMHMTVPLTEEHTRDGLLPKRIRESWEVMAKEGRKRLDLEGIPGHRVEFYMTSDIDDCKLVLAAAKVTDVSLAAIMKKGDGEAQRIIRLSFRLQVAVSHGVEEFAVMNYGNNFWNTLKETDEKLFDDEEDDEAD